MRGEFVREERLLDELTTAADGSYKPRPLAPCEETSGVFLSSSTRTGWASFNEWGLDVSGVVTGEGGMDSVSGCEDEDEAAESFESDGCWRAWCSAGPRVPPEAGIIPPLAEVPDMALCCRE